VNLHLECPVIAEGLNHRLWAWQDLESFNFHFPFVLRRLFRAARLAAMAQESDRPTRGQIVGQVLSYYALACPIAFMPGTSPAAAPANL
jgi:hypothetical protein